MDWKNWQTYVALVIVIITLGIFLQHWIKVWLLDRKKDGCGGGCGCDVARKPKYPRSQ